MQWLDILTGEVRARRDSREHADTQRNEVDGALRRQRVTAALRYVARPALEQVADRFATNGRQLKLVDSDGDGVELVATDGSASPAHVGVRPGDEGQVVLYWRGADAEGGQRQVEAGALTTGLLRDMARAALAANGSQDGSG